MIGLRIYLHGGAIVKTLLEEAPDDVDPDEVVMNIRARLANKANPDWQVVGDVLIHRGSVAAITADYYEEPE